MPVNLRPHSEKQPLVIEDSAYQELVQRKAGGWSQCADETEWLAKLHYLREGLRAGKLTQVDFDERESRLVVGWLRRRL
jgi:hypothetical protein